MVFLRAPGVRLAGLWPGVWPTAAPSSSSLSRGPGWGQSFQPGDVPGPGTHLPASSSSFFQGMQHRMLRHILRAWARDAPSDSTSTTWALEPLGGLPGGAVSPGCSPPRSSLEKVRGRGWDGSVGRGQVGGGGQEGKGWAPRTPRARPQASGAPALLDTLRRSFLWAAGRRQQARCLLLWHARAQQSQRAARWHRHTLQRR